MRGQIICFLTIWIINCIISLVYLFFTYLRKEEKQHSCLIKAILCILCPVVGLLFFGLSYLLFRLFFSEPVDLDDVVFSKDRVKSYVRPDEERERNMVPLEEAIEIMDKENLRDVMMNVLRGDIRKSLTSISLALNSEDTETAHYAASVLQDALNDFRDNVDKQFEMVKMGDENSAAVAEALLGYMDQVLRQNVFTDIEQEELTEVMDETGEILYEKNRDRFTPKLYEDLCLRTLAVKDYETCGKWCERAIFHYPEALPTYTCQLKLYFASGQKEKFFEVMEDLKKSPVVIDNETLELLRVFQ